MTFEQRKAEAEASTKAFIERLNLTESERTLVLEMATRLYWEVETALSKRTASRDAITAVFAAGTHYGEAYWRLYESEQ